MRIPFCMLIVTLALATAPRTAAAQTGEGFQVSVGLGWGFLGCEFCDGRDGGLSPFLAVGSRARSHLFFGVSLAGWLGRVERLAGTAIDEGTEMVALLSPTLRVYVAETGPFFFLGGAGLGLKVSTGGGGDMGVGGILGLGYDLRLSDSANVTLSANAMAISISANNPTVLQAGLAITTR